MYITLAFVHIATLLDEVFVQSVDAVAATVTVVHFVGVTHVTSTIKANVDHQFVPENMHFWASIFLIDGFVYVVPIARLFHSVGVVHEEVYLRIFTHSVSTYISSATYAHAVGKKANQLASVHNVIVVHETVQSIILLAHP